MSQIPSPPPPPLAPPPYMPPYGGYNRGKGYGVASLVLGIITILFVFTGILAIIGILTGIIGLILGRRGMTLSPPGMAGMATAGFVCSLIGLCIVAIGLLLLGGIAGLIAGFSR